MVVAQREESGGREVLYWQPHGIDTQQRQGIFNAQRIRRLPRARRFSRRGRSRRRIISPLDVGGMGAWRARQMVLGLAGVGLAASYVEVSTTTPRCGAPAATGAHVLYNATFAHSTGETRELQDQFVLLHEVVGGTAIGDELAGACAGDVREWGGRDEAFPEPFRHMSHWNGAKVVVTVKHVTSVDDFVLIETLQKFGAEVEPSQTCSPPQSSCMRKVRVPKSVWAPQPFSPGSGLAGCGG